jgi:hypothetical protein
MRWADFPESDFTFDEKGIHAKNKNVEKRRLESYNSNEVKYCGCIERDLSGELDEAHAAETVTNFLLEEFAKR